MRPAMIAAVIGLATPLSACGDKNGDATGPERGTAAGEVLGGEVSDAMVPLDTVRSTSPAAPRPVGTGTGTGTGTPPPAAGEPGAMLPEPQISGGPEPFPEPAAQDTPSPPQP